MEHELVSESEYNTSTATFGMGEIFSASSMLTANLRTGNALECGSTSIVALGTGQKPTTTNAASPSSSLPPQYHRRSHSDPVFLASPGIHEQILGKDSAAFNPSHMGTSVVGFQSVSGQTRQAVASGIFAAGPCTSSVKTENDDDSFLKLTDQVESISALQQLVTTRMPSAPAHFAVGCREVEHGEPRSRIEGPELGTSAVSSPTELTAGFCSLPTATFSRNVIPPSKPDVDDATEQQSDSHPASSERISPANTSRKDTSRKRGGFNGRTNEELSQLDPKRVRRILANREVRAFIGLVLKPLSSALLVLSQSAARSKERKVRYTTELDNRLQTLSAACERLTSNLNTLRQGNLQLYEQAQQYHTEMEQLENYLEHLRTTNKDYSKRVTTLQARISKHNSTMRVSRARAAERTQYSQHDQLSPTVNNYPEWLSNGALDVSWHGNRYISQNPGCTQGEYRSPEPPLPNFPSFASGSRQAASIPVHDENPVPGSGHFDSPELYDNSYETWSYLQNKLCPEWDYRQDPSSLPTVSPPTMSLLEEHLEEHTRDWAGEGKMDLPSVMSMVEEITGECSALSKPVASGLFPGLQFA